MATRATKSNPEPVDHRRIVNSAEEAAQIISAASVEASHRIANEAADAIKVLTAAAADALVRRDKSMSSDHDLLIELRTRMEGLEREIQRLSDGTLKRITELEVKKADKDVFDDLSKEVRVEHEKRLRGLEVKSFAIWIAIFVYTVLNVAGFIMILKHIAKVG